MNKGLELVEARWLFDLEPSQAEVVIHPQSIVHSMVEYRDGTIIAQMGIPDMRIPIAYALSCPQRLKVDLRPLELTRAEALTFLPVERRRYPALALAYRALREGGASPAVLNAANEVAVEAFLQGRIGFRDIHRVIEKTLDAFPGARTDGLAGVLEVDRWARSKAGAVIERSR
jgi:1-deoxy-D-xylulose-5-phosphate reductoisomerase